MEELDLKIYGDFWDLNKIMIFEGIRNKRVECIIAKGYYFELEMAFSGNIIVR